MLEFVAFIFWRVELPQNFEEISHKFGDSPKKLNTTNDLSVCQ